MAATAFVADTHALLWHLREPRRLGRGAQRAFASADSGRWLCQVPAIVLAEIALLHERNRIPVGPKDILQALAGHPGFVFLAFDVPQAIAFASTPDVRDPMDRLVLAAALATNCRLVSADATHDGHGVTRVWD